MAQLALAAGVTTAATASAATAAAASSTLAMLTRVATVIQILGAIGAGVASARTSAGLAREAELEAGQEQIASAQRSTQMKRELARVLGENEVAFAAGGVEVTGGGIAGQAAAAARRRATDELSIERRDADFRRAQLRLRARGYRRQAAGAIGGSLVRAAGTAIDLRLTELERG